MSIVFDPSRPEAMSSAVERALGDTEVRAVRLDLGAVTYLGPGALEALGRVADLARVAGKELFVEGVNPVVYKALHIAKLAHLLLR